MTTVTADEFRKIAGETGFVVTQEEVHDDPNSAVQRLRFTFWFRHDATGLEGCCSLRHNLEGHNDVPSNTHRLYISLGRLEGGFSNNMDFVRKECGPSAETLKNYLERLCKVLDDFIGLPIE